VDRAEARQQMNMILRSSNLDRYAIGLAETPPEKAMKLCFPSVMDVFSAVLCRENNMTAKDGIGGRHGFLFRLPDQVGANFEGT
jgi:hypothetical protein